MFVLMKDGEPFELQPSDRETMEALENYGNGAARFAFASTNRDHVEAMRQALPDMLDSDKGPEQFTITQFRPRT